MNIFPSSGFIRVWQSFLPLLLFQFSILAICISQNSTIGGPCQGCEALLEYGDRELTSSDTLPLYLETEPKIKVTGIVYKEDGTTPAADIILYVYHTNRDGIYPKPKEGSTWESRHGMIRGWIKTNADGRYTFYTFRPGAYPNRQAPEHIHVTVKEPGKEPYYIEDFFFDDDPLLTPDFRNGLRQRGGSGICEPKKQADQYLIHRNIILGKNIPNYY